MPRSFSFAIPPDLRARLTRDPRTVARAILGVLLLGNLIAAYMVARPVGGSAEELDAQISTLQSTLQRRTVEIQGMRQLVSRMNQARTGGDAFLGKYFLEGRTKSSTIVGELDTAAKDAGLRSKERSFNYDPIEGTDQFSMLTVVANYEGTYGDLLQFVNKLDKSSRFLIIDTLTAAPQQGNQGQGLLNVQVKFNAFVRQGAPLA
ncbi:MAG: type 4a pilus biogenesis protein PilO [Bryobacteraceae bacterium]|nr:type 4a pilus biogenesis protein PilO [Bryobacteraceae bacterium]